MNSLLYISLLVTWALANPVDRRQSSCAAAVSLTGNPFLTRSLHPTNKHQTEVLAGVASITTDPALSAKASRVAAFGTFLWLEKIAELPTLESEIKAVPCSNILGIVLNDLPTTTCSVIEQSGDLDLATYKSSFIDPIVATLKKYPNVAVAAIIAPGAVGNLITNSGNLACANAASVIKGALTYALQQLNLPNVILYVDAGDAGTLGWPANLQPAAQFIATIVQNAGSPKQFRGFSANVASYNAWSMSPGEFECPDDSACNLAQDEKRYVALFAAGLAKAGVSNYAIVDTSRNAVQGLRIAWGDWCNVNGAGLGVRPTSNTSDPQTDAFVWVKAVGESDGTSDSSDPEYDSYCGKADAFKPSPRRGVWNQAYFNMLISNAVPAV